MLMIAYGGVRSGTTSFNETGTSSEITLFFFDTELASNKYGCGVVHSFKFTPSGYNFLRIDAIKGESDINIFGYLFETASY